MDTQRILGVDEAGKGPVIGPMIVVGVIFKYSEFEDIRKLPKKLKNKDIIDSKKLKESERKDLSREIKAKSESYQIINLEPPHIDRLREKNTMNEIVVDCFSTVIEKMEFDKAILDAADVNEKRFATNIEEKTETDGVFISKHKADEEFPAVSAASIIAKDRRDEEIDELEKRVEEKIGNGYPNSKTKDFLRRWMSEYNELPLFCRKSWKTAKKIKKEYKQSKIGEY